MVGRSESQSQVARSKSRQSDFDSALVVVRQVQPSDFEDLLECYYSYLDEFKLNPALGLPRSRGRPTRKEELEWFSNFCRQIAEGMAIGTVALVDSHVVGLCEVTRITSSPETSHRGDLGIAIRKEYRNKGIGAAMLKHTLHECKGKFEVIELAVFSNNLPAKRLYEKFHFKCIGVRPHSIKRGSRYIDEDLMSLAL